jgi:hypothetical protein
VRLTKIYRAIRINPSVEIAGRLGCGSTAASPATCPTATAAVPSAVLEGWGAYGAPVWPAFSWAHPLRAKTRNSAAPHLRQFISSLRRARSGEPISHKKQSGQLATLLQASSRTYREHLSRPEGDRKRPCSSPFPKTPVRCRDRRIPRSGPGAAARVSTSAPQRPTPEKCVEAYYLQRTRFETTAERKLRRRQLTEDGNVEISGRDLREGAGSKHGLFSR